MPREIDAEERLAELIWRTIKLRVSLLVLTILVLLIVWSALASGNKQAQLIDIDFCKQLIAETNQELPVISLSAETWCDASNAHKYVEGGRTANEMLLMASQATSESNKTVADKLLKQYVAKKFEFAEYDEKRRAAYPLQIQVSSEISGSNIILNGQFVAMLLPFCVLLVLSVIILLGFQQASYKQRLVSLLASRRDGSDRALRIARGQFFAGIIQDRDSIFSKVLVLSPERLATGSLYILLVALFAVDVFLYIANIIDLTNSIFFSYPFLVYSVVFVLGFLLLRTRRFYLERPRPVAGFGPSRGTRWLEGTLAVVGISSFILPWASGEGSIAPLWGFRLLLRQHSIRQIGDIVTHPLAPGLFFEVRIQMILALLFLVICSFNSIFRFSRNRWLKRGLQNVQQLTAILILFLSLNFLIYIAILESGRFLEDNPFLAHFYEHEQGYPMSFYNPTYGFILFLVCAFGLIWLSLRERKQIGAP